jgi:hypothetical protein
VIAMEQFSSRKRLDTFYAMHTYYAMLLEQRSVLHPPDALTRYSVAPRSPVLIVEATHRVEDDVVILNSYRVRQKTVSPL